MATDGVRLILVLSAGAAGAIAALNLVALLPAALSALGTDITAANVLALCALCMAMTVFAPWRGRPFVYLLAVNAATWGLIVWSVLALSLLHPAAFAAAGPGATAFLLPVLLTAVASPVALAAAWARRALLRL